MVINHDVKNCNIVNQGDVNIFAMAMQTNYLKMLKKSYKALILKQLDNPGVITYYPAQLQ